MGLKWPEMELARLSCSSNIGTGTSKIDEFRWTYSRREFWNCLPSSSRLRDDPCAMKRVRLARTPYLTGGPGAKSSVPGRVWIVRFDWWKRLDRRGRGAINKLREVIRDWGEHCTGIDPRSLSSLLFRYRICFVFFLFPVPLLSFSSVRSWYSKS